MTWNERAEPPTSGVTPVPGPSGRPRTWPLMLTGAALVLQSIGLYLPSVPSTGSTLPLDKVAHVLMFAVVTGLAVWAGIAWKPVVAVMIAQAGISELVQGAVLADRGGDWADFIADLLGVALGLLVVRNLPDQWQLTSRTGGTDAARPLGRERT